MKLVLPLTGSGQALVSTKPVNELTELTGGDRGSIPRWSTNTNFKPIEIDGFKSPSISMGFLFYNFMEDI